MRASAAVSRAISGAVAPPRRQRGLDRVSGEERGEGARRIGLQRGGVDPRERTLVRVQRSL
jgi:hypothetical protein